MSLAPHSDQRISDIRRPPALPGTAMIMAAGLATRMRPLTDHCPKALLTVGNKTLIDHTLDRLPEHGILRAVVNVHHGADQIETHLHVRQLRGMPPETVIADERACLMDTGGGIKQALKLLDSSDDMSCHSSPHQPILVFNGKCIWTDGPTPALYRMADMWNSDHMDTLMLVTPTKSAVGYDGPGDFDLGPDQRLKRVARSTGQPAPYVFTGIQMINPQVFHRTPDGPFSMRLVWTQAMTRGRLFGLIHDGGWMQVWTISGLQDVRAYMTHPRFRT